MMREEGKGEGEKKGEACLEDETKRVLDGGNLVFPLIPRRESAI